MTLESKYNVPTVGLHTHVFEKLVRSVTQLRGMPSARYAFVPMPVMGKTPDQLTEYIEGVDPVYGRPVFQEIAATFTLVEWSQPADFVGRARRWKLRPCSGP